MSPSDPPSLLRFIRRTKEGMQRPPIFEADDGHAYVLKLDTADPDFPAAELVAAGLAVAFGVPLPQHRVLSVPEPLTEVLVATADPDLIEFGESFARQGSRCFGSRYLPGVTVKWDPALRRRVKDADAVVLDLYSRKFVGWAMSDTMHTSLCLTARGRMLAARGDMAGAVHHTDRGSPYASGTYRAALQAAGLRQSMSRKGDCWDNAVAESCFGTLEQELVPDAPWRDLAEARRAVSAYIHGYYNCDRRHSTLWYRTPREFEDLHQVIWEAAA